MNTDESLPAGRPKHSSAVGPSLDGPNEGGNKDQPVEVAADEMAPSHDTADCAITKGEDSNFCIDNGDDDEERKSSDSLGSTEPEISEESGPKQSAARVSGEILQSTNNSLGKLLDNDNKGKYNDRIDNQASRTSEQSSNKRQPVKVPPRLVAKPNTPLSSPRSPSSTRLAQKSTSNESESYPPQSQPQTENEWNPFSDDSLFHDEINVQQPTTLERSSSLTSDLTTLRHIFDTEYERAIEHQEISWKAKYAATRISFLISCGCMLLYLWLGCMFYRSEAGWSVPDALLFTVYSVTTVGYGGPQPLPNSAAFHAFTSIYVLVGISGVTVLGAHTYQLITLEATRIRAGPLKKRKQSQQRDEEESTDPAMERFRRQFMSELEDRVRERPALDRALDGAIKRFQEVKQYMETTRSGRVLAVILPFVGMILLGALVVGLIEGWTPLESIYWSIVTLTTVGYGDYTPTKNSSVWFCTLFFIPSSLFFLSFFLAQVAKSYIRLHAIHVMRLERRMRDKAEKKREVKKRAERARQNASTADNDDQADPDTSAEQAMSAPTRSGSSDAEEMESGFTTISYTEDEDMGNSRRHNIGLFGEGTGIDTSINASNSGNSTGMRYRESVVRNKFTAPDPNGKRAISFGEALQSLNESSNTQSSGESSQHESSKQCKENSGKPSLEVRMRVQERIARIIAEEVAGFQNNVSIKGSTVSLTISTLHDTADKWGIPPQAWKAFRAVSFRCLLFVGERDMISDGGEALFQLNAIEFHGIFSPILAAMGDGPAMEEWLTRTDILADAEFGDGRGRVARGNVSPNNVYRGQFT
jgi:hypothetical protein